MLHQRRYIDLKKLPGTVLTFTVVSVSIGSAFASNGAVPNSKETELARKPVYWAIGSGVRKIGKQNLRAKSDLTVLPSAKDLQTDSNGQVVSGTQQKSSQRPHHSHHLRNALIGFGACFALVLAIAVAAK